MAMTLGELTIEMGIFADTKEAKAFAKKLQEIAQAMDKAGKNANKTNTNLQKMVKGFAGVVTAISGALFALNKLTDSLVASNQEFLNLTRTSDIALNTFQKWDAVGKMFGVRNAAQQLENLNQRLFELQLTGEGAKGFMIAGINPMGQDANGVMEQLRSRVAGLDDTAAAYLLRQIGLDPSMLHLLRLGRKEFEELGKAVKKYQLTEDQRKDIQAMNAQLEIARIKLQYLKDRAILAIMPYFTRLMTSIASVAEMFAIAGKHIGQFVVKWRGLLWGITAGLAKIKAVNTFFKSMVDAIGKLIVSVPIFGKFLGKIGGLAAKALLPFIALYLLLDDLATFFQGGDSLIGRVIEWGKETGSAIGDAFKKMFGGDFFGGLGDLGTVLGDTLKTIMTTLLRFVDIALGTGLSVEVQNLFEWFKDLTKVKTQDEFNEVYMQHAPEWAKKIWTPAGVSSGNVTNKNQSVTMDVVINTSQAGQAVSNELDHAQNVIFNN